MLLFSSKLSISDPETVYYAIRRPWLDDSASLDHRRSIQYLSPGLRVTSFVLADEDEVVAFRELIMPLAEGTLEAVPDRTMQDTCAISCTAYPLCVVYRILGSQLDGPRWCVYFKNASVTDGIE